MAADGFRKTADALEGYHDQLERHGKELRKRLRVSSKAATGGDSALSGLGGTPKLGVRLQVDRGRRSSTVTLTPSPKKAAGPWTWIDSGTNAGMRRTRGRSGIYRHPGTKGKNAWYGVSDPYLGKAESELARWFNTTTRS